MEHGCLSPFYILGNSHQDCSLCNAAARTPVPISVGPGDAHMKKVQAEQDGRLDARCDGWPTCCVPCSPPPSSRLTPEQCGSERHGSRHALFFKNKHLLHAPSLAGCKVTLGSLTAWGQRLNPQAVQGITAYTSFLKPLEEKKKQTLERRLSVYPKASADTPQQQGTCVHAHGNPGGSDVDAVLSPSSMSSSSTGFSLESRAVCSCPLFCLL